MNKYQKKLNSELKEVMTMYNYTRKQAIAENKWWLGVHRSVDSSPCCDCDNYSCSKLKNKIIFCKDRR